MVIGNGDATPQVIVTDTVHGDYSYATPSLGQNTNVQRQKLSGRDTDEPDVYVFIC